MKEGARLNGGEILWGSKSGEGAAIETGHALRVETE